MADKPSIRERLPDLSAPEGSKQVARRPTAEEAEQLLEIQNEFLEGEFDKLCAMIAQGSTIQDALGHLDIPRLFIDKLLRTSGEAKAKWDDAKMAKIWKRWSFDAIEEILVELIMGDTSLSEIIGERGLEQSDFYLLILKDPIVADMYEDARCIQMEGWADKLIEIGDDDTNDMAKDRYGGDKPNTAAVQRSRLMGDNRKWLMARIHHKRFGDRIQQDQTINIVVDHAERLDAARKRKEQLARERKTEEQIH